MGSNVFGTPITTETLKAMPEYHDKKEISQADRATVALEMKSAEGKDTNAIKYVDNLMSEFGAGDVVSTRCLIYNATGRTLTFVIARDWKGRVCQSPYPVVIANGQWGVFLHGQYYNQEKSSRAGIVYSGFNAYGVERHWLIAFSNSVSGLQNQVFTGLQQPGHYEPETAAVWSDIDRFLSDSGKLVYTFRDYNRNEALLFGSIGNTAKPYFEAIMTLPEAFKA